MDDKDSQMHTSINPSKLLERRFCDVGRTFDGGIRGLNSIFWEEVCYQTDSRVKKREKGLIMEGRIYAKELRPTYRTEYASTGLAGALVSEAFHSSSINHFSPESFQGSEWLTRPWHTGYLSS